MLYVVRVVYGGGPRLSFLCQVTTVLTYIIVFRATG